jgi:hypothetical protein
MTQIATNDAELPAGPESHDQAARFMTEVMPSLIGAGR